MARYFLALILFALALSLAEPHPDAPWRMAAAWADDDDDGRGDDDDDDDGPRVIRRQTPQVRQAPRRQQVQQAPRRAVPAPPPPTRASDEIIARDLDSAALERLRDLGFTELRHSDLAAGGSIHRLRKPGPMTLDQALEALREITGAERADFNHFYRGGASSGAAGTCRGTDCPARQMIAWPALVACGAPLRIGMIDTGLNASHASLADADLTVHRLETDAAPSGAVHGTAVAALFAGAQGTRAPGLVPHLPLLAVDAFHSARADERADAFALIEALDWLAAQQAAVVNLSLAGPDNRLLAEKIADMERRGILLVAAAGNGGPAAGPAYPAAYDTVLAVTAVDRRGQVWRRAGRGPHIDIAAPGVEVWTAASISGARPKTGTSFAAPFVASAAALILQAEPGLAPADLRARLIADAEDLGTSGRDDIFGHGLLRPAAPCMAGEGGPVPGPAPAAL
ncbi:MAG: S8 family serine peptidase [Paracoccus sp. (in: a-proteobacteria)]|nr:S8 family serine peptidase [Paracoccus sp. (in: a-proteobacteria)]